MSSLWNTSRFCNTKAEALVSNIYLFNSDGAIFAQDSRIADVMMAFTIGFLLLVALAVMIVGPRFGEWLASKVHLGALLVPIWPYFRWTIAIGSAVFAIEVLYVLAPNAKQRLPATLPGAVIAVTCWIVLSHLLGECFRHFASFNKTYGTLGAAIALMVWFYWTGFAMLVGAELNAELAKARGEARLSDRQEPVRVTTVNLAA